MKTLIIKGTAKEVEEIVNNLNQRFPNITILELLNKYGKEELILQ